VEVIDRDPDGRVKRHFVVSAFAGRWLAGEPQTGPEAGEVRFVAPADVARLPTTPGLAGIVTAAAQIAGVSP
jgi:hypothetical protein